MEMTVATGNKVNKTEIKDFLLNAPAGMLPYTVHLGIVTQATEQQVRDIFIHAHAKRLSFLVIKDERRRGRRGENCAETEGSGAFLISLNCD